MIGHEHVQVFQDMRNRSAKKIVERASQGLPTDIEEARLRAMTWACDAPDRIEELEFELNNLRHERAPKETP